MISGKNKVYTSISTFSKKGMEIYHDPKIPKITYQDLSNLANYYSIVLNYGESSGALYGPLPIAYHTEFLLYVYTFKIQDPSVKDERIIKNNGIIPASLLIFFPTITENYSARARDKISTEISNWVVQFSKIQDVSKKHIDNISLQIETAIYKEQTQYELSEIEEANVVIGKSIELLHNVTKYQQKPVKILISGTDEILISIAQKAIFENNSSLVSYYKYDDGKIDYKLNNIEGSVLLTTAESPNIHKYLSSNLDGVIHFANFSSPQSTAAHTDELEKIIKQTNQNCIVSFVIAQTNTPIKINDTKIPEVLKEGIGRSISLIDLGQQKNTISTSIIEFLDKLIESIGKRS
ncbi:MAG: hypothetical protein EAX90_09645 [Candidatus Heimdallarchaeota archaeon]|nr:hypothetical protein [Candidatus Heimdallarchaeota archaeon]